MKICGCVEGNVSEFVVNDMWKLYIWIILNYKYAYSSVCKPALYIYNIFKL